MGLVLAACKPQAGQRGGESVKFKYARNISLSRHDGYTAAVIADPWHKGRELHRYIIVSHCDSARMAGRLPEGTVVYTPLRRAVVFTAAHANLIEWLHAGSAIRGVADPQYMHIADIQARLGRSGAVKDTATPGSGKTSPFREGLGEALVDVGNSMKPDIERIVDLCADAVFLSPFENSGGYGRLEEIGIPIIECADYMETGALGRAEWMRFYGLLFGREDTADSLFAVVERNYNSLRNKAAKMGQGLQVLPDRKTGSVWYVPGGQSSMGLLYKDAGARYAFAGDKHTGSLALPFETVLDRMGAADIWILSHNGAMTRRQLLAEYGGYAALKPFRTGEVYGCQVDKTPYFEEVSWRPDWLLADLIKLVHPQRPAGVSKTSRGGAAAGLRYYHKIL